MRRDQAYTAGDNSLRSQPMGEPCMYRLNIRSGPKSDRGQRVNEVYNATLIKAWQYTHITESPCSLLIADNRSCLVDYLSLRSLTVIKIDTRRGLDISILFGSETLSSSLFTGNTPKLNIVGDDPRADSRDYRRVETNTTGKRVAYTDT
jgi:hypothetical protein